jgi:cell division protein FtsI/penicillin-binding protein 2
MASVNANRTATTLGTSTAPMPAILTVSTFVESGGHGGETAAPIARKMIAEYLHVLVPSSARQNAPAD